MQYARTYKDHRIHFEVPDPILDYFRSADQDIIEFLSNDHDWFEVTLFELLRPLFGGKPLIKSGKRFRIVFTEVIMKFMNGSTEGWTGQFPSKHVLVQGSRNVASRFVLRYALLKDEV